jgi:hypothetical protein
MMLISIVPAAISAKFAVCLMQALLMGGVKFAC